MIKAGDILFVHYAFNLCDKTTYMAPAIRGVLSMEYKQRVYANHVAAVIELGGVLRVIEAGFNPSSGKAEVFCRTLDEWQLERKPKAYFIVADKVKDVDNFTSRLMAALGKPYDFKNVLLHNPIYLATDKWVGPEPENLGQTKGLQCANLIAFALNLKNWHLYNPRQLHKHLVS